MSNYITVENGLIKRIVPNGPINVEFGSTKGYTYNSTMEAQPDSEFEDETYPGLGGTGFYVQLKNPIKYEDNPLSQIVVKHNPILDTGGWTWTFEEVRPVILDMTAEYPLEPDDCFTKVEYMTPQEMLDKDMISVEQYINLVNNK